MAGQAVSFVLEVFFGLFIYGFLLRFLMQALRAPFRNPAGQAVIALTDWAVKPLRRVIPGAGGYDWASLVAAWLTQVALIATLYAVFSSGFAAFSGNGVLYVLASAAVQLLKTTITLAMVVVIVQAILSWVAPDGPLAGLLNALTFPFLRPLRRVIPPIGGALDLSPLVLIVVLQLLLMLPVRWLEGAVAAILR
ncbi:MAG: YggT family protein [Burkholderiales bacterium]|nr:YggT family protein [Burkholderiales bacterium]